MALKLGNFLVQGTGTGSNVRVMRIQGPLCFANAARTKERILGLRVLHTSVQACSGSQSASCTPHLYSPLHSTALALWQASAHVTRKGDCSL